MNPNKIKQLAEKMGWKDLYVIMKHGMFYRPDAHGYTDRLSEAWKVPLEIAQEHEYPRKPAKFKCADPVTIKSVTELNQWNPETSDGDMVELLQAVAKSVKNGIIGIAPPMGESVASNIKKPTQGWVVGKIGKPENFDVEGETLRAAVVSFACKCWGIEET